jgi:PAS domain S-box-containing protein
MNPGGFNMYFSQRTILRVTVGLTVLGLGAAGLALAAKNGLVELSPWLVFLAEASIFLIFLFEVWGLYGVVFPLLRRMHDDQHGQQTVLEQAPAVIVTASDKGVITSFNRQAELLLGLPEAKVLGRRLESLFDDDAVTRLLHRPYPGLDIRLNSRLFHQDGKVVPVEVAFRLQRQTQPARLVAVIEDRSEYAACQEKLGSWERAFANASWGIVIGDPAGGLMREMNPAFAEMYGYEREEMLGRPIVEIFAPAARNSLAGHIEQATRLGSYSFESVHLRRGGVEFPVGVEVTVVYDALGEVRQWVVNVHDLSRRAEMERRLGESEEMRRLVLDTQSDFIVRWRPDGTIVYANRAYAELFGEAPEAIIGQNWEKLLKTREELQEQAVEVGAFMAELKRNPRRVERVGPVRHPLAGRIWVLWTVLPLYGEAGALDGFQVSGHDITARKAAEDALVESESWFRAVFDSMFHYAAVLDPEGRVCVVNQKRAEFVGRTAAELTGKLIWEVGSVSGLPDSCDRLRKGVAEAAAGRRVRMEIDVVSSLGEIRVFDASLRPIIGRGGKIRHLVLESLDITEYREQERQIEERDARFHGVAESMPGIAFEFVRQDDSLWTTYVNKAAISLFDLPPESVESGGSAFLEWILPEHRSSLMSAVVTSERKDAELQWVGRLNRDEAAWLSLRAIPRRIDGLVIWSGVGLNITEMKEKEFEIEKSRTALRELSAHYEMVREDERKRMAREVHDELGQNLTALRMGLSVLSQRAGSGDVAGEAGRLKALVDQSISVVRGIATTLRPAALDLGISAALNWLGSEFEANTGLLCAVDVNMAGSRLDDDKATALFRIAQESLTNVARHAEASHAWIRVRRINHYLVLEVGDDGRGFESSLREGSGFGLLGMKERALSLGGEMAVNSHPEEGTVISIHIPLK